MQDRGVVSERGLDVAHRGQRLVIDLDELGGVLRERAAVGDHDRDAVAGVARLVDGERPVRRQLDVLGDGPGTGQPARPLVGEVGAGERRDDALGLACGSEVDARDPRVRVGTADDGHPDHACDRDVVDEAGLAGQELGILLARDRRADVRLLLGGCHHATAAAARTALTMFW